MIIDSKRPAFWYDNHVTLSALCRSLHTGYHNTLRILETEGIHVIRIPFGTRFRYLIRREDARRLTIMHGSEFARARRSRRSAARTNLIPLAGRCPHCGQMEKQWRNGLNSAGHREVKCGHCKRFYTITFGKRPPLESVCVHCGADTRQWRQQLTSAGNLTIRCGHCRRHYTIQGNRESTPTPRKSPLSHPRPEPFAW